MKPINRILLTGAAGALGRRMRPALARHCTHLRVTDIAPLDPPGAHEEVIQADLADPAPAQGLTREVDAVVHLAGKGMEAPFDDILRGHMLALYNVFEGARRNGVRRVIWASSIHAVGFYPFSQVLDSRTPPRPDTNYGAAKAYGEGLAQYYWDKYGVEAISMRICSCFPEPADRRMLSTWLSYADLERLIGAALTCTRPDHSIIYGVSANTHAPYDNRLAAHIGYLPQDNAEAFRAKVEADKPPYAPDAPEIATHGGAFATFGHFDD